MKKDWSDTVTINSNKKIHVLVVPAKLSGVRTSSRMICLVIGIASISGPETIKKLTLNTSEYENFLAHKC